MDFSDLEKNIYEFNRFFKEESGHKSIYDRGVHSYAGKGKEGISTVGSAIRAGKMSSPIWRQSIIQTHRDKVSEIRSMSKPRPIR